MGEKGGRKENLVRLTPEKAREIGARGGIRSGEVKREKKRMSQIYADFLMGKHKVTINDTERVMEGPELLSEVMKIVLSRGDSASVSLLKELREATEGGKLELSGGLSVIINKAPVSGEVKDIGTVKRQSTDE